MKSKIKKSNKRSLSTKRISEKTLNRYVGLNYNPLISEDLENGKLYYIAKTPELPGLISTGDTIEEAKADFELAKIDYIEALLKMGIAVPLPTPTVKKIVFFTGIVPDNIIATEPLKPISLSFDLSRTQKASDNQPKELSPGIFLEYVSPESKFEVRDELKKQADYSTSAPTLKTDQRTPVLTR